MPPFFANSISFTTVADPFVNPLSAIAPASSPNPVFIFKRTLEPFFIPETVIFWLTTSPAVTLALLTSLLPVFSDFIVFCSWSKNVISVPA